MFLKFNNNPCKLCWFATSKTNPSSWHTFDSNGFILGNLAAMISGLTTVFPTYCSKFPVMSLWFHIYKEVVSDEL